MSESELNPIEKARFAAWKSQSRDSENPYFGTDQKFNLDRAVTKAEQVLSVNVIDPNTFRGLYGDQSVDADIKEAKALHEKHLLEDEHPELRKFSQVLEAIIHEQAELNEWFGANVVSIRPALYDDVKNGVDEILEFENPERQANYLALAVDVTYSKNLENKLKRIKGEILAGKLSKIKYFVSKEMGLKGELSKVPRIVIAMKIKTLQEIAELWLQGKNSALGKHEVQLQILRESLLQLEVFGRFAEKHNQTEIALAYNKTANILKRALDEKLAILENKNIPDDGTLMQLSTTLNELFK